MKSTLSYRYYLAIMLMDLLSKFQISYSCLAHCFRKWTMAKISGYSSLTFNTKHYPTHRFCDFRRLMTCNAIHKTFFAGKESRVAEACTCR
jgi:hypothetical protein